jgi:hypothetical protein
MRVSLIQNRRDFTRILQDAINRTERIQKVDPAWALPSTILKQLQFVAECIAKRRSPTATEMGKISLGQIAVKNLEESDPDYAEMLMAIDNRFGEFERLPA